MVFQKKSLTLVSLLLMTGSIAIMHASFPDQTHNPAEEKVTEEAVLENIPVPVSDEHIEEEPHNLLAQVFRPVDIGITISLAELYECLAKTREDLHRATKLDRVDKAEIIKILEAKETNILAQLTKLDPLGTQHQLIQSLQTKKQQDDVLFWTVTGVLGVSALALFCLTTYDHENGWQAPSKKTTQKNLSKIRSTAQKVGTKIKNFLTPK